MMANFGDTIKTMAKTLLVIGLISCVILFFTGNAAYQEDKDYIEYATAYGGASGYSSLQRAGDNAYNGLQLRNLSITLAISLAIGYIPLYGFGVLVDNSERQTDMLRRSLNELEKHTEVIRKLENSVESSSLQVSNTAATVTQLLAEQCKIKEYLSRQSQLNTSFTEKQPENQAESTTDTSESTSSESITQPLRRRMKQS